MQRATDTTEVRATNITWHEGHVKRKEREKLLAQIGETIWFTGLSGSGKSTIAFTHNDRITPQEAVAQVIGYLESQGLLADLK